MKESKLQSQVCKLFPMTFNVHGHAMQAAGWPDVYFVLGDGRTGWLELKVGKNQLSDLQRAIIRKLRRLGVFAACLRYDDGTYTMCGHTFDTLNGVRCFLFENVKHLESRS